MPNALLGELELKIGDEVFLLRPCFEAMLEMEDRAGCGLLEIAMAFDRRELKFRYIAALLYGGIRGTHVGKMPFTFEQFGNILLREGASKAVQKYGVIAATFLSRALVGSEKKIEEAKPEQ